MSVNIFISYLEFLSLKLQYNYNVSVFHRNQLGQVTDLLGKRQMLGVEHALEFTFVLLPNPVR